MIQSSGIPTKKWIDLLKLNDLSGGGYEYHWTLLPKEAQAELERRRRSITLQESQALVAQPAKALVQREAQSLNARASSMRDARALMVLEVKRRTQVQQISERKAAIRLLEDLKLKEQDLPTSDEGAVWACDYDKVLPAAKAANERNCLPSLRILQLWLAAHKKSGLAALAPTKKQEKVPLSKIDWFPSFILKKFRNSNFLSSAFPCDPSTYPQILRRIFELMEYMRFYARPQKPSLMEAYRNFVADFHPEEEPPSYHAVNRAVNKLGPIERHRGREGALQLKNRMAFVARGTDDLLAGTIYIADGKTFDAEIENLFSKQPFKPEITSVLDVATRKCVGFAIRAFRSEVKRNDHANATKKQKDRAWVLME